MKSSTYAIVDTLDKRIGSTIIIGSGILLNAESAIVFQELQDLSPNTYTSFTDVFMQSQGGSVSSTANTLIRSKFF